MSKYRISITQSHLLVWVQIGWVVFLATTFWLWKQSVLPGQTFFQSVGSVLTIFFGVRWTVISKQKFTPSVMSLEQTGEINWLQGGQEGRWNISHKSKVCGPFICLHLLESVCCNRSICIWLAKDQVSESDFRRLCRIILRCQQAPCNLNDQVAPS